VTLKLEVIVNRPKWVAFPSPVRLWSGPETASVALNAPLKGRSDPATALAVPEPKGAGENDEGADGD
jgi:hypothetical protein